MCLVQWDANHQRVFAHGGLQQQKERQQLQQRAEAAEAALEKQRAATAELRNVLDALRWEATGRRPAQDGSRVCALMDD